MIPPKIGNSPFENTGAIRPMGIYPDHRYPGDGQPRYTGRHFLIHKETKGINPGLGGYWKRNGIHRRRNA